MDRLDSWSFTRAAPCTRMDREATSWRYRQARMDPTVGILVPLRSGRRCHTRGWTVDGARSSVGRVVTVCARGCSGLDVAASRDLAHRRMGRSDSSRHRSPRHPRASGWTDVANDRAPSRSRVRTDGPSQSGGSGSYVSTALWRGWTAEIAPRSRQPAHALDADGPSTLMNAFLGHEGDRARARIVRTCRRRSAPCWKWPRLPRMFRSTTQCLERDRSHRAGADVPGCSWQHPSPSGSHRVRADVPATELVPP